MRTQRIVHNAALRERVRLLLAHDPEVRAGVMFGCPAFFLGRRMLACVYGDEVGVKLPSPRVEKLLLEAGITPFQPYGKKNMRQWVALPNGDGDVVEGLLREAVAFAREHA